ncbi:hypothetical protein LCGC14_1722680 [marine sediment metagenome]|uniref:DUF1353 domain-containing protein n=1 Tax=marine sediment metagenome TaxID=412755 RepID=A0A0F9HBR7_9ZZZZ
MNKTRYTSRLEVSPEDDGEHWRVLRSFLFECGHLGSGVVVRVEAGFITDFASFPKILWRGLMWWLPGWAKYSKPSPIHDRLYQSHYLEVDGDQGPVEEPVTRKRADQIFLEAMHVAWRHHKSGRVIARLEYWGVRAFGWLGWARSLDRG